MTIIWFEYEGITFSFFHCNVFCTGELQFSLQILTIQLHLNWEFNFWFSDCRNWLKSRFACNIYETCLLKFWTTSLLTSLYFSALELFSSRFQLQTFDLQGKTFTLSSVIKKTGSFWIRELSTNCSQHMKMKFPAVIQYDLIKIEYFYQCLVC